MDYLLVCYNSLSLWNTHTEIFVSSAYNPTYYFIRLVSLARVTTFELCPHHGNLEKTNIYVQLHKQFEYVFELQRYSTYS